MKKLILVLSVLIAMPAFAQSYFNGGQSPWGAPPASMKTEIVYKDVVIDFQDVTLAVVKSTIGNEVSYKVRFFGQDNILKYAKDYNLYFEKGEIEIDGFTVLQTESGHDEYAVFVYFTNEKEHKWKKDPCSYCPTDETTEGEIYFTVKKPGVK